MTDIRSFFKPVSSKSSSQSKAHGSSGKRKRTDDSISYGKQNKSKSKKLNIIYDSDEEDFSPPKKHEAKIVKSEVKKEDATSKVKKTTTQDFFGDCPIHRSAKKERKPQMMENNNIKLPLEDGHDDEDFKKTLLQLDEEYTPKKGKKMRFENTMSSPRRSPRGSPASSDNGNTLARKLSSKVRKTLVEDTPPVKRSSPRKPSQPVVQETPDTKKTPTKLTSKTPTKSTSKMSTKSTNKTPSKSISNKTPSRKTPIKSKVEFTKKESTPTVVEPTPQKTPKDGRRKANPAYFSYLNREGPQALGSKEIPEGAAGCLDNCTFVITGILDSIEKGDATELIKRHGGKVTGNVSKKSKYLVVGRGAGEKKLEKADEFGIEKLSEDDLFELIRTRPGKKGCVKPAKVVVPESPIEDDSFEIKELEVAGTSKSESQFSESTAASSQSQASFLEMTQDQSQSQDSQVSLTESQKPTDTLAEAPLMWVDKYKPKNIKQIIGQHGDKSNVRKLMKWLQQWDMNNSSTDKSKGKYNRDSGAGYKAALLSGPPGIGKTTSATLVCKELEYSFVEFNASDTRSKKSLQTVVSELLNNQDITSMMNPNVNSRNQKHCLIMDEVDGMAGNEDRGGMQELIQLIKNSKIPIICMCNDRMHQKIRSLANHCFDLRFQRPQVKQIKASMMSVACKEGIKIPPQAMDDIIIASNQDIRQVLHNLSMWSAGQKSLSHEQLTTDANNAKKDLKLGPFEVVRKVFMSGVERSKMSIHDKFNLFFHDYSMGPLFVQENYINVTPQEGKSDKKKHLDLLSKTADSLCYSDLIERSIRSRNSWNLLPTQALFASVLPGEYMQGFMSHMINFPSWLGKNSTRNKNYRLLQELQQHMRLPTSGSLQDINLEYCPHLHTRLTKPLLTKENQGVAEVIQLLDDYDLTRDDMNSLLEVSQFGANDPWSRVPSKVKSAFTRAYNQGSHLLPHSTGDIKKKGGKKKSNPLNEGDDYDDEMDEVESDDDISSNSDIKKVESKSKGTAASSKGKSLAKGKSKVKKSK